MKKAKCNVESRIRISSSMFQFFIPLPRTTFSVIPTLVHIYGILIIIEISEKLPLLSKNFTLCEYSDKVSN